jgi:hypothetical protein
MTHADLKAYAFRIAQSLATKQGTVTSTEVLEVLKEELVPGSGPLADALQQADPRFLGVIFRFPRGYWERVGTTSTGSHHRPVTVWKIRSAQ